MKYRINIVELLSSFHLRLKIIVYWILIVNRILSIV